MKRARHRIWKVAAVYIRQPSNSFTKKVVYLIPFHFDRFHVANAALSGVPARDWQHIEWHLISKGE